MSTFTGMVTCSITIHDGEELAAASLNDEVVIAPVEGAAGFGGELRVLRGHLGEKGFVVHGVGIALELGVAQQGHAGIHSGEGRVGRERLNIAAEDADAGRPLDAV